MNIKGHPIHIMLIHFPVALFPMDLCCNILALWLGEEPFLYAGYYALLGGVALGWLAMITGMIDLGTWKAEDKKEHDAVISRGIIHGGLQITVVLVFTGFAFLQWQDYPYLEINSMGMLIAKVILVAAMFAGNYFGGELLIKHFPRQLKH